MIFNWFSYILLFILIVNYGKCDDPTTTVAPLTGCKNGGFFDSTSASCSCPNFWTGRDCSDIVCINGGYPDKNKQRCFCPAGYFGVHCEAVTSITPPASTFTQKTEDGYKINLVYVNMFSDYWGRRSFFSFQKALERHYNQLNSAVDPIGFNVGYTNAVPQDSENLDGFDFDARFGSFDKLDALKGVIPTPFRSGYYACFTVPLYTWIQRLIQDNKLQNTAITVITQHPSDYDDNLFNQLVNTALAFNVRINIVFSDDQTFVRCKADNLQLLQLQQLSRRTDGIFVTIRIPEPEPEMTVLDMVFASHHGYQPVAISTGNSLKFVVDPFPNNYAIVVPKEAASSINSGGCPLFSINSSLYGEDVVIFRYYGLQSSCILDFSKDLAFPAKVFVYNQLTVNYRFFTSFVEDFSIDTSNSQPDQGNALHPVLHWEATGTTPIKDVNATFTNGKTTNSLQLIPRPGFAFETYSNNSVVCQSSDDAWIWITISATVTYNNIDVTINRYVFAYCFNKSPNFEYTTLPPSTTAAATTNVASSSVSPVSTVSQPATTVPATTVPATTVPATTAPATTTTPNPCPTMPSHSRTYVVAYSNIMDGEQYEAFISVTANKATVSQYNNFGQILFDVNVTPTDDSNLTYHSENSYQKFTQDITTYTPGGSIPPPTLGSTSQILDALHKIIDNSSTIPNQNSIVAVALSSLPPVDFPSKKSILDYYPFINQNIKIFFFIDWTTLQYEFALNDPRRGTKNLNLLAAATGGHVIVTNQKKSFADFLTNLYAKGPSQNLVYMRNIAFGSAPVASAGQLDISRMSQSSEFTFTINVALEDANTSISNSIHLQLFKKSDGSSVTVSFQQTPNSNFYMASQQLDPDVYTLKLSMFTSNVNMLLRGWNSMTNEEVEVTYADLKDGILPKPDNINGAAVRANLANGNAQELSVTFMDCTNNDQSSLLDAQQTTLPLDSAFDDCSLGFKFVPLMCSSPKDTSTCVPGTEKFYQIQYSSSDGFVTTRTFACSDYGTTPSPECAFEDSNGNVFCSGNAPPFKRGPSGKLIDCSGSGNLYYNTTFMDEYNTAPYVCKCTEGASGLSCEDAQCLTPNTQPGAVDTMFHSFTVIVGMDENNAQLPMGDAATVLNLGSIDDMDHIWQYQLVAYCWLGQVVPLYIGSDLQKFKDAFQTTVPCPTIPEGQGNFDLTKIYQIASHSVGPQQKGLVLFFNEQHDIITVDSQQFIQASQMYHLQFYVHSGFDSNRPSVNHSILEAIYSTGGSLLIEDVSKNAPKAEKLYGDLLASSVSFNYYQYNPTATSKDVSLSLEENAADIYVIAGDFDNPLTPAGGLNCEEGYIGTPICKLLDPTTPSSSSISYNIAPKWVSVIVLGGVTPSAILVNNPSDDTDSALSVSYTVASARIAIHLQDGYSVVKNFNSDARLVTRTECSYTYMTYIPYASLPDGPTSVQIQIQKGNDTSATFTKVIPFGTSKNIQCQNGVASTSSGVCTCPTNDFGGADCSIPQCNDGLLSTWSKACNCRDAVGGGRTCNTPRTNFFDDFEQSNFSSLYV